MLTNTIKSHLMLLFKWFGSEAIDDIIMFCNQLKGGN